MDGWKLCEVECKRVVAVHNCCRARVMISLSTTPFLTSCELRRHALRQPMRRRLPARLVYAAAGERNSSCKVAGMGSAGLDYLALVSSFPKPDDKIRTESFEVQIPFNINGIKTALR